MLSMLWWKALPADMAELVDAPDLGSGFARSEGSSPFIRTFRNLPWKRTIDCTLTNYLSLLTD
jgi:hypothetical protein